MLNKTISFLLLLTLLPIIIIVSILIYLDDGLPILFRQKRVGKNNNLFWIYKFRTMKKDVPNIASHLFNHGYSSYTRLGPFFRKFSIDELPQLINIFKGDMNFIGPRPSLFNQDDLNLLRKNAGVDSLTPGVTGWAQVNGRDELSIDEKVEMDVFYLKNQSLFMDIKIFFLTIFKVINSDGNKG